ncbi:MAG: hypothetical protein KGH54_04235 [Candidatus Micrarchaeota archaeon]|nr:hypothetical protein [Candidatus Micrarchaeota archaeon]
MPAKGKAVASSAQAKAVAKELSKRRVFIFAALFAILALGGLIGEESDMLAHAFDDIAILSLSVIVLLVIGVSWKKVSFKELIMQHNVITLLFAVALAVQIAAIFIEMSDPADFGNEIPSLILILLAIANRFV